MQSETGITFVFVTHDQEEALTMSDRIAVMNEGKILQYGNPREIYHHPENKFVANFIGDSNFLLADIKNGNAVLTDGTELKLSKENKAISNGQKSILIRPEHVQMSKSNGHKTAFEGKISNIVYFGTDTHFHLELKTGDEFTIRKQNTPNEGTDFEIGAVVELTIDENAIQILSD